MTFKISGGQEENGVVVGNAYDKYSSGNSLTRFIMKRFEASISDLVSKAGPGSIHEIGCGEGYWTLKWNRQGFAARGSDFSPLVIQLAKENAIKSGQSPHLFETRNIYEMEAGRDSADLIVCSEVLEHLEKPENGLKALHQIVRNHLILSVPREPLWRILNMARGKYLSDQGNTPGHIHHWSRSEFSKLVSKYFKIIEVKNPIPWTVLLCLKQG